ncbi:DUF3949 domain-containing protein [Fictibacillus fluitans]|uniref:DUF3949 domain-containing protein n=1 Tax=Fictibacillus fluitans TaxID=3058422 RepID=A0ABT8HUL9_9BACL|nr:DUF3949 domain-containing protein [Fictibacillus sp. NE201]MDN4524472.1 DUF3949 domain-containing protein [Fictibacillus sp. NE201]
MITVYYFFGGIALLYFLVMIPVQYAYISGLKERSKRTGLKQQEMYDAMPVQEQQLHYHTQGNLFNLPSALVASLIYKVKHGKSQ